jgi:hypothetical protein
MLQLEGLLCTYCTGIQQAIHGIRKNCLEICMAWLPYWQGTCGGGQAGWGLTNFDGVLVDGWLRGGASLMAGVTVVCRLSRPVHAESVAVLRGSGASLSKCCHRSRV